MLPSRDSRLGADTSCLPSAWVVGDFEASLSRQDGSAGISVTPSTRSSTSVRLSVGTEAVSSPKFTIVSFRLDGAGKQVCLGQSKVGEQTLPAAAELMATAGLRALRVTVEQIYELHTALSKNNACVAALQDMQDAESAAQEPSWPPCA